MSSARDGFVKLWDCSAQACVSSFAGDPAGAVGSNEHRALNEVIVLPELTAGADDGMCVCAGENGHVYGFDPRTRVVVRCAHITLWFCLSPHRPLTLLLPVANVARVPGFRLVLPSGRLCCQQCGRRRSDIDGCGTSIRRAEHVGCAGTT